MTPFEKALIAELKAIRKELHNLAKKDEPLPEVRNNIDPKAFAERITETNDGYLNGVKIMPRP